MTLSRLSRNTLTLLVSNIGGAILLFALSALIGRTLGSDGLGAYAVVLAWVYPLSLLVEFGLTTLMTRDVSANPDLIPDYMDSITRARLIIGGTVMIIFILVAPLISRDPIIITGLQVSAPMLILQAFYSQFTTVFKVRGAMALIPLLNIGMIGVQVILTAFVLINGGTVIHALILNTVTSTGQLIAAWGFYRWQIRSLTPQAPLPRERGRQAERVGMRLWSLLRAAFPFALAAVFAALQTRVVFYFLERSVSEAGYFSAANRFVEAARLVPNALFGALFPMIGSTAIHAAFQRATWGLAAFGLIAGLGFTVIAPFLLTFVFGESFAAAVPTLILLGWSLAFVALRGVKTIYWYAHKREQFVNAVNALAVVLIIILSVGLIPQYGAVGAALATLITEIGAMALLYMRRSP